MDAEARKQELMLGTVKNLTSALQSKTANNVEFVSLPNIEITNAGTEYTLNIPEDFQKIIVKCRDNESIRYSLTPGDSLTPSSKTIPKDTQKEFGQDQGYIEATQIYFSAFNPCTIEIFGY